MVPLCSPEKYSSIGRHAAAARRTDEAQIVQTGTAALDGRQRSGPAVGGGHCLTSATKTQVLGPFPTVVNGPFDAPFSFSLSLAI